MIKDFITDPNRDMYGRPLEPDEIAQRTLEGRCIKCNQIEQHHPICPVVGVDDSCQQALIELNKLSKNKVQK